MTRRALCKRLAVCLLLGTVATVAVAWGFVYPEPETGYSRIQSYRYSDWSAEEQTFNEVSESRGHGRAVNRFLWHQESVLSYSRLSKDTPWRKRGRTWGLSYKSLDRKSIDPSLITSQEHAFGWPFLALWVSWDEPGSMGSRPIGGIALEDPWQSNPWSNPFGFPRGHPGVDFTARALPLYPIWWGFLLDTLFFGSIFTPLVFGPSILRERRRRGRGRCPKCSYDLLGVLDAGCPECGWGKRE